MADVVCLDTGVARPSVIWSNQSVVEKSLLQLASLVKGATGQLKRP